MREILFRGKRTDTGEWVYGDLLNVGVDYDYAIRTYGGREHGQVNAVNEKTVGQYTGLTDRNGKKVFEGDIVFMLLPYEVEIKGIVRYQGAAFYIATDADLWNIDYYKTLDVIGNIHDNPELLRNDND